MPKLYVVKHTQVNVIPEVPPHKWHISDEGKQATVDLIANEFWSDVSNIYHSSEPKAMETAQIIADKFHLSMHMESGLDELEARTGFLEREAFLSRVGNYLEGHNDPDFEDYELATTRIVRCVHRIVEQNQGQSVAIVSHGRILSALYAHLFGRRITRAEWQSIEFPDLSVIDLDTWKVERGFLANSQDLY